MVQFFWPYLKAYDVLGVLFWPLETAGGFSCMDLLCSMVWLAPTSGPLSHAAASKGRQGWPFLACLPWPGWPCLCSLWLCVRSRTKHRGKLWKSYFCYKGKNKCYLFNCWDFDAFNFVQKTSTRSEKLKNLSRAKQAEIYNLGQCISSRYFLIINQYFLLL